MSQLRSDTEFENLFELKSHIEENDEGSLVVDDLNEKGRNLVQKKDGIYVSCLTGMRNSTEFN